MRSHIGSAAHFPPPSLSPFYLPSPSVSQVKPEIYSECRSFNLIQSWNLSVHLQDVRHGYPKPASTALTRHIHTVSLSPSLSPGFPELVLIPLIHAIGRSLHLQNVAILHEKGRGVACRWTRIHTLIRFCPAVQLSESRCFSQFSSSVMNFSYAEVFHSNQHNCVYVHRNHRLGNTGPLLDNISNPATLLSETHTHTGKERKGRTRWGVVCRKGWICDSVERRKKMRKPSCVPGVLRRWFVRE